MDKTLVGFGMDGSASLIQGQDMSSSPSGIHLVIKRGGLFNWPSQLSIPKGKANCGQPEPFKDGEFHGTAAQVGCNYFSHSILKVERAN